MIARSRIPAIGALASFALAALVWTNGAALVDLSDRGNILATNEITGVTRDTVSALLGRVEFGLLAAGALFVQAALGPVTSAHGRLARLLRAPALSALVFTALMAFALLGARSVLLGDQRYFHLEDDAMISMRYARNFVHGAGLVYNPGERVEGYTDFLWVILMAAAHLVAPDRLVSAVMLVVNAAIGGLAVVLVQGALRRAKVAASLVLLTCLALAADANLVMWISSGLEAVAMALCVTACAWALLERERDRSAVFLVSLAAIPLIRSDGALLAAMLGAIFLFTNADKRRALMWLAAAAAPTFAHLAFRVAYYGYPFPNTYYLKMIDRHDRLLSGLGSYGFRFATGYLLLVPLVAYVASSRRFAGRARLLAGVVFAQVAYSIYVGGDTFWYLRFVMPVIPLAYMMGALGLEQLLAGAEPQRAMLVAGMVLTMLPFQTFEGRIGEVMPRHGLLQGILATADTLRANLPPGASVSVYSAGTVPYFAPDLRFVDVLGKTEAHIGHQATYVGSVIGHNKFDFAWIYGTRRPDVAFTAVSCDVVADFEALPDEERRRRIGAAQPDVFIAPLYELEDSFFRDDYLAGKVTVEHAEGCFFVRRDSSVKRSWTYAE